jgi:hypothetical protein
MATPTHHACGRVRPDSRESIKHFKCRVLDLLEIFVKRQHDSHLIPELIGPLAAAVRDTVQNKHQLELSTKLAGFLRRLFKSKQSVTPPPASLPRYKNGSLTWLHLL